MKTKLAIIAIAGVSFWYSSTVNKKYNNISNKLDMIIEVSNKATVDSLKDEIMDIGWKLDSMVLKYDEGWEFTN